MRRSNRLLRRALPGPRLAVLVALGVATAPAAAQAPATVVGWGEVSAGSELEEYLRVLQVAGLAEPHPWSVRAFSAGEIARLVPADSVVHPWMDLAELARDTTAGVRLHWVRPEVRTIYNSAFPHGSNGCRAGSR